MYVGPRPCMKSKPVSTWFQFRGFVGLGLIGNYLLGGVVVLHGNLLVKWRSTHIPQQNFQFWWICGFGAYWELFARGGVVLHGNLQVKWRSTNIPQQNFQAGLGLIGSYLLGGVVLHGKLHVKWRSTHIPQQNFQFWWICGLGLIGNYLLLGGVVLHRNLQVKWKSNHVPRRGSAVLVGLRWGSLFWVGGCGWEAGGWPGCCSWAFLFFIQNTIQNTILSFSFLNCL